MSANPYDVLKERGFVQQVSDEAAVKDLFAKSKVTVYAGYDPTADSLHVGNLVSLMLLQHIERLGHRPLLVLGGGTARVGDPSGKTEMRQMLGADRISSNLQCQREQLSRFFDVAGGKTVIADNSEWLLGLKYIDFLRDIGAHFSVNRMLAAEAYKLRLERGLSFLEFNYQILQAYDFLELRRRYDCRLQIGGDDQWGNILAGVDLCRRVDSEQVFALTVPLLLTATGEKMGKTAAGAVWLDERKLSAYDYYQYWINVHDADVVRLLGYYTFLPMDEIRAVKDLSGSDLNSVKTILAFEATRIVHGDDAARKALAAAQAAFSQRQIDPAILPSSALPRQASANVSEVPTLRIKTAELAQGVALADLIVRAELSDSKAAARRLIGQGAVKLNDAPQTNEQYRVTQTDLVKNEIILRVGKKKVHRILLTDEG